MNPHLGAAAVRPCQYQRTARAVHPLLALLTAAGQNRRQALHLAVAPVSGHQVMQPSLTLHAVQLSQALHPSTAPVHPLQALLEAAAVGPHQVKHRSLALLVADAATAAHRSQALHPAAA